MRVTDVNRHSHIDNIVRPPRYKVRAALLTRSLKFQRRQKGGIGSAAYDPKQKDIRAFFGGISEPESGSHDKVANAEDIVE
jgi:hypothetical protein